MVELGAENVKNEDDIQGNARPLPGLYHVVVKDVDETFHKHEKVIIDFEVLAGTTPDQEGRVITEFFAITEKALPRLQRLAIVLRVLKPGEPPRSVEFGDTCGRFLVIEVEENKYEKDGKTIVGVRISFMGFWSMANKAVADVPKNEEAMKLDSGGQGESPPSATTGDDPYADL